MIVKNDLSLWMDINEFSKDFFEWGMQHGQSLMKIERELML